MRSAPSHSIQASLSHGGHGAARCHTTAATTGRSARARRRAAARCAASSWAPGRPRRPGAPRSPRACASASKRGSTTMWLPVQQRGARPDERTVVVQRPRHERRCAVVECARTADLEPARRRPGRPDTISFGRPVLPPEVGAFQAGRDAVGQRAVVVDFGDERFRTRTATAGDLTRVARGRRPRGRRARRSRPAPRPAAATTPAGAWRRASSRRRTPPRTPHRSAGRS